MEILNAAHIERLNSPGYTPSKAEQVDIYCAVSENTPRAAFLFITCFCKSLDPEKKLVHPIQPWPFIERMVYKFHERGNKHIRKSRQMFISWLSCFYALWELQFVEGTFQLFTSRKEQLVDDGGDKSTVRSLLGRIRHGWVHLPRYLQRDLNFSYLKIRHARDSSNAIVGESANPNMARGTNPSRIWGDEWAFVPDSESCYNAMERACPDNKVLISTFNYPTGNFYRLWEEKPKSYDFIEVGWWEHPERVEGMYYVGTKRRSKWYDTAASTMTDDAVARELDMDPQRSGKGFVWGEFNYDAHVRSRDVICWNPELPLYGSLDFGIGAYTAGIIFQVANNEVYVILDYELGGENADFNAQAFWDRIQETGFDGKPEDVQMFGDPAGNAREQATGSRVVERYRSFGFVNFHTPKYSPHDGRDLVKKFFKQNRIYISEECTTLIKRIPDHRYPVNDNGDQVGNTPIKNKATHICDGMRYGIVAMFAHELVAVVLLSRAPRRASGNDEGVSTGPEPEHRKQINRVARGLEARWVKRGRPIASARSRRW